MTKKLSSVTYGETLLPYQQNFKKYPHGGFTVLFILAVTVVATLLVSVLVFLTVALFS